MVGRRDNLIRTSTAVRRFVGAASKLALVAVFSLQALVPHGYMPVAIESGAILQICPDGLYFTPVEDTHAGHHPAGHSHHHHAELAYVEPSHEHHAATENCAFATLLAEAQEPGEVLPSVDLGRVALQDTLERTQVLARTPQLGFISRAPPYFS